MPDPGHEAGPDTDDPVARSVMAYSGVAGAYELAHRERGEDRVNRFAALLPASSRVLDAGCGPGRDMARFARLGHRPTGVDLNPAFVTLARSMGRGPVHEWDLRDLSSLFPGSSFDAVWAEASLVHLSGQGVDVVLAQFAQLLRPGGHLYASVMCRGETGWLDEPDGRRWYTVWHPERFAESVETAGFEVDEVVVDAFVQIWAVLGG